jgi:hypothetical protein
MEQINPAAPPLLNKPGFATHCSLQDTLFAIRWLFLPMGNV